MPDVETHLTRWQSAGVIDADLAARIRAFEARQEKPSGLQWQVIVALIFGGILLVAGVALFVNAHWDDISPLWRYIVVIAMVTVFHLGAGFARPRFPALSTTLHAVGTLSTGAAIALVGQIFNIQEHWPAAVLLWAVAALAGWALLRDQAQQTIAILLVPTWLICEWIDVAARYQGAPVYIGRMLAAWAVLFMTFFLASRRKLVWGAAFAAGAVALIVGGILIIDGWDQDSWFSHGFLPLHTRVWGWVIIAALPLLVAFWRMRQSLIPVVVILAAVIFLPSCRTLRTGQSFADVSTYSYSIPNIFAHLLVGAFAGFLGWWGVRQNSKPLVNYGILLFAVAVGWFYFTDLLDKFGRSLGLIGLGILFLVGGWLLERTRRKLIARISSHQPEAA